MKTKISAVLLFLFAVTLFKPAVLFAANHNALPTLAMFHSPKCYECMQIKEKVMPDIEKQFKGKVLIEYYDIDQVDNYKLFLALEEKYHVKMPEYFPIFFYNGKFMDSEGDVRQKLILLLNGSGEVVPLHKESLPKIDLVQRFQSFTPAAIIAVGLIDGINPCAVTVIVFFMSFLTLQGYRKREIIVIGLLFIFSVYLTYVLIGFGLFEFLYRLQGFWLVAKIVNITVGSISICFSIYALYDFIQYRKTKSTDDMLLSLPAQLKNQIHKVIGLHYRTRSTLGQPSPQKHLLMLAVTALITGFLVSVLEAVCVAKIYLPTIIFILKTTELKLKAAVYLLLYNLLFVVPLFVIFLFALFGTSSEKFSKILKGHFGTIKILMGLMFLGLGLFLIFRA